jgi:hypothetical protein
MRLREALAQFSSIDFQAAQINRTDSSRIRDVIERIGVEDDEVRAFAGGDHAKIVEAEDER